VARKNTLSKKEEDGGGRGREGVEGALLKNKFRRATKFSPLSLI
jgi:hypothetical protein